MHFRARRSRRSRRCARGWSASSAALGLAGPMPARVAAARGYEARQTFLDAYRENATAVREGCEQSLAVTAERSLGLTAERSRVAPGSGHPRSKPDSRTPLQ